MPAGTGVCVVKTVPARAFSSAASKSSPSASMNSRIRSMPRKPACPSLVWKTSGAAAPVISQYERIARMPPMPSSSSCSSRWSDAAAVQPVGDVAQRAAGSPRCRSPSAAAAPGRPARPRRARRAAGRRGRRSRSCAGEPSTLAQQRERQLVGVDDRVALLLPALARQRLAEVAVPVQQSDADDRHAEVAGRLEVVAGEDAEAAGVLRQHGGDAELGREVARSAAGASGRATGTSGRRSGTPRGRRCASSSRLMNRLSSLERLEPGGRDRAEEAHRVVVAGLPRRRRRRTRRGPGSRGARTTAGWCQLLERTQRLGQDGADGEPSDGAHRKTVATRRRPRTRHAWPLANASRGRTSTAASRRRRPDPATAAVGTLSRGPRSALWRRHSRHPRHSRNGLDQCSELMYCISSSSLRLYLTRRNT